MLKKDFFLQFTGRFQRQITAIYASKIDDVEEALKLCKANQKPTIYLKGLQISDQFDEQAYQFVKENLARKQIFNLVKQLNIKLRSQELAIIQALLSPKINETAMQQSVSVIQKFLATPNAFPELQPLLQEYLEFSSVHYAGIVIQLLDNCEGPQNSLFLATAHFQIGNHRQASKICQQLFKDRNSISTEILIKTIILQVKILDLNNSENVAGKLLFDDVTLAPNAFPVSVFQTCFRAENDFEMGDFSIFYFAKSVKSEIFADIRIRTLLGCHLLKIGDRSAIVSELLFVPVIHVIVKFLLGNGFSDTFYYNLLKIINPAFRCLKCDKKVSDLKYKDEIKINTNKILLSGQVDELREILQGNNLNGVILDLIGVLQTSQYHDEQCRSHRILTLLYLSKFLQQSAAYTSKFTDSQFNQIEGQFKRYSVQLSLGYLVIQDLTIELVKDYENEDLLQQIMQIAISNCQHKVFKNSLRFLERQLVKTPDSLVIQKYILYFKLYGKIRRDELFLQQQAQMLFSLTSQSQFIFIKAYFQVKMITKKTSSNFYENSVIAFGILQNYLRMEEKRSPLDAANAWYNVATLLYSELDQLHIAIHIFECIISGRQPKNFIDSVLSDAVYDIVGDKRLKKLSAHNLCNCYAAVGSHERALQIRKTWFTFE